VVLPPKSPEVNHGDQDETTNIASSAMTDNLIGVMLGEEGEALIDYCLLDNRNARRLVCREENVLGMWRSSIFLLTLLS